MEKLGYGRQGKMYPSWCSRTVAGVCGAPKAASRRSGPLKINLSWLQTPQLPFREQSRHWKVSHSCGRHIFWLERAHSTERPTQHCYNNYNIHFQTDSHVAAHWVSWSALATYGMIRKVFIKTLFKQDPLGILFNITETIRELIQFGRVLCRDWCVLTGSD